MNSLLDSTLEGSDCRDLVLNRSESERAAVAVAGPRDTWDRCALDTPESGSSLPGLVAGDKLYRSVESSWVRFVLSRLGPIGSGSRYLNLAQNLHSRHRKIC